MADANTNTPALERFRRAWARLEPADALHCAADDQEAAEAAAMAAAWALFDSLARGRPDER